jgi:hypothetical protein
MYQPLAVADEEGVGFINGEVVHWLRVGGEMIFYTSPTRSSPFPIQPRL